MSTPEQREKWRARSRDRYSRMTPEERAKRIAQVAAWAEARRTEDPEGERRKARQKRARQVASWTPEQWQARCEWERAHYLAHRDDPAFRATKNGRARVQRAPDSAYPERRALRAPDAAARLRAQQAATYEAGASRYRYWTPEEDAEALREDLTILEIALRLGRTRNSVLTRRRDLRRAGR